MHVLHVLQPFLGRVQLQLGSHTGTIHSSAEFIYPLIHSQLKPSSLRVKPGLHFLHYPTKSQSSAQLVSQLNTHSFVIGSIVIPSGQFALDPHSLPS